MDLEEFKRSLRDLARQLRPSELPAMVQRYARHLPASKVSAQSYEELFDLLLQSKAISPENVSLLSMALNKDSAFLHFLEILQKSHTRKTIARRAIDIFSFKLSSSTYANVQFKELLRTIGTQLKKDDLSTLKFLCQDVISRRQLDSATSSLDLLTCLQKKRCITARSPEFLRRILQDADRSDLSNLVENYMRSLQPNYSANSNETSESLGDYHSSRQYKFHRSLKQLADKLGCADLQSLKVACKFYVPESTLEKVKTTCELFGLLEEKGKVSTKDLSFLEDILRDKLHLVHELYEKGFGCASRGAGSHCEHCGSFPPRSPVNVGHVVNTESLDMGFNRLLRTIGPRLTAYDVQQMKFLHIDGTEVETAEPIVTGLDLLIAMEKRSMISPHRVQLLQGSLEHIGRKDLATVVTLYVASNKEDGKQNESDIMISEGTHYSGDGHSPVASRDSLIMQREDRNDENQSKKGQKEKATKPELADLARHAQARCELLEKLLRKEEECSKLLRDKMWLQEQVYELKTQLSFGSKIVEEMKGAECTVMRTNTQMDLSQD